MLLSPNWVTQTMLWKSLIGKDSVMYSMWIHSSHISLCHHRWILFSSCCLFSSHCLYNTIIIWLFFCGLSLGFPFALLLNSEWLSVTSANSCDKLRSCYGPCLTLPHLFHVWLSRFLFQSFCQFCMLLCTVNKIHLHLHPFSLHNLTE